MLPIIEFQINSLVLLLVILCSSLLGFLIGNRRVAKKNNRIARLEKELADTDAEILESQKECLELESRLRDLQIPVIPMTHSVKDDNGVEDTRQGKTPLKKDRSNRTA